MEFQRKPYWIMIFFQAWAVDRPKHLGLEVKHNFFTFYVLPEQQILMLVQKIYDIFTLELI